MGFEPHDGPAQLETFLERVHPDDRARVRDIAERALREKIHYEQDYRIVHPDGNIRNIHTVGHPVLSPSGDIVEFVGTVMDVTDRRQAEQERERLRQALEDLAHINRVTMMGELTASLAHEVNQPIAAAVTDAKTCIRWLMRDHPDLKEAREAASRTVKDATRAGEIINRIRLIFKKGTSQWEPVDVNETIRGDGHALEQQGCEIFRIDPDGTGGGASGGDGRSRAVAASHDEPDDQRYRCDEGGGCNAHADD